MDKATRDDLENTVAWVAEAHDALQAARTSRDRAIRRALEAGATYKEIGDITGLSRGQLDAIRRGKTRRGN